MSDDASTPPPAPPGQHRIALGLAAAVVIVIAILAGVVYQSRQATAKPPAVAVKPQSLAVIDPTAGVIDDVPLGATPESMAAGYGKIWIGNQGGTVSALAISAAVSPSPVDVTIDPAWLATGDGAVWVYDGQSSIAEIGPNGGLIEGPHRLWACTADQHQHPHKPRCGGAGLAVVGSQVWVGQAPRGAHEAAQGIVVRVDRDTLKPDGTIPRVIAGPLSTTPDGVWSAGYGGGLQFDHIDPATEDVTRQVVPVKRVATVRSQPTQAVSGFGFTWAATAGGVLYRLSAGAPYHAFQVPVGVISLAVSDEGIWLASSSGRVYLFSPSQRRVVRTYSLGDSSPVAVVSASGRIWVAVS